MNVRFICVSFLFGLSLLAFACDREKGGARNAKKEPSPLASAILKRDYQQVDSLLQDGVSPDDTGTDGISPLGHAILKDDLKSAEMLLKAGASVTNEVHWRTPLGLSAGSGSASMTKLLLKLGVNPNARSSDGYTAMSSAALSPTTNTLTVLFEAGAEVDVTNRFGSSAFLKAMSAGAYENALWLMDHGANPFVTHVNGSHPFQMLNGPAFGRRNFEALQELRRRFLKHE